MSSRLMGCVCCGARWVEDESEPPALGCDWCQSTAVALEKNLTGETKRIIKQHGFKAGVSDDEVTTSRP